MPWNLLLENGDALLLENGDNLLLEAAPRMPKLILFDDVQLRPAQPHEETTPLFDAKLVDDLDSPLAIDVLEAMTLQVFVEGSETSRRPAQDVLNANDVTITYGLVETTLVWLVQVTDTAMEDLTTTSTKHIALFEYAWDSEASGSLTDPIATTSGDATVTITVVGHGLTGDNNHIFLIEPVEVGGLCLNGSQKVTEIVDLDTLKIEARKVATGTATGGGSFDYLLNSKTLKYEHSMTIKRVEPVC